MYHTVGIMTLCIQETPEGILHGTCSGGVNMTFHCGQMDDILPDKKLRYPYTFRINLIQCPHLCFWLV